MLFLKYLCYVVGTDSVKCEIPQTARMPRICEYRYLFHFLGSVCAVHLGMQ